MCKGSELMDIKQLIGETTDYDKNLHLKKRNLRAGVRVSVRLLIVLEASLYLVYLMIVSWWDLRMQKVMRRKLVKQ